MNQTETPKQETIAKMTGYKATNADMKCRAGEHNQIQFELGKWYEVEGELKLCGNGFHFCEQPSGVWAYYTDKDTRVFKIEAEEVLKLGIEAGADFKRVCRRIRFVSEVVIGGYRNTGFRNTGDGNTGDGNTGNRNTGFRNTGFRNTGDRNTGNRNTGDGNTGFCNTGFRNTGDGNTGDGNTGDGNATNCSAGFFCSEPQIVRCFDMETGLTRDEFTAKYPSYYSLFIALHKPAAIDFADYADLPGITPEKLKALHEKHLAAQSQVTA